MTIGVWILGDQLIENHPILAELEANKKRSNSYFN